MTKQLLVVEDDGGHAALIQAVLAGEPEIEVRVVGTGREALEILIFGATNGTGMPDAVLLDVDLPGLSGLEVLRELARKGIARRIPVIVYTAAVHPEREARARKLGAAAFVEKPTDFAELTPLIRKHLGRSRRRWLG